MSAFEIIANRFQDSRGWFCETWNQARFDALAGPVDFCQDNHSLSLQKGTLRGLHFQQQPNAQAKLVRCLRGRIFDVAVDIRRTSPTYKKWLGIELSASKGNQLFVPAGYAHAFLTLEDCTEVAYKVDAYYSPESDGGIAWNDPEIGIIWPAGFEIPLLSDKDKALPRLAELSLDFAYDGKLLQPLTAQ
jgi:dTDP-4-dehydrorhamnose 3,5-epimerase